MRIVNLPTSYGRVFAKVVGGAPQPLILCLHGSGPTNSSDTYDYFLHQYMVRISYHAKFTVAAFDCPGYGRSEGNKSAIRTFPLEVITEVTRALGFEHCHSIIGHSQGGAAIFNAGFLNNKISEHYVGERPVIGDILRFSKFNCPVLLIYDIEDKGHPIEQGKLMYRVAPHCVMHTYRTSREEYWVCDNFWNKLLEFHAQVKASKKAIRSRALPSRGHSMDRRQNPSPASSVNNRTAHSLERRENSSNEPRIKPADQKQRQEIRKKRNQVKQQSEQTDKPLAKCKQEKAVQKQEVSRQRCTLCLDCLWRPHVTNCHHFFCEECIKQHLWVSSKCPLCRTEIARVRLEQEMQTLLEERLPADVKAKRRKGYETFLKLAQSVVFAEVGNTAQLLATKASHSQTLKRKYNYTLFAKQPPGFKFQAVQFNINMGDAREKPVRVAFPPYTFDNRTTFSYTCSIKLIPRDKAYQPETVIHRVQLGVGTHSKRVVIRRKVA